MTPTVGVSPSPISIKKLILNKQDIYPRLNSNSIILIKICHILIQLIRKECRVVL